ncbi:unnamed protein product [Rotaria socialis]|uniref:Reverse transcriptase domain-containing protein n=2 Tax=Rotaria socialis TaxID=392032 RepID=A0A820GC76_9BILA|nr:unnamed protein product [Rotaria socialis]
MNGTEDVTKMLALMNQNVLDMKENTDRIDEKLDRINDKVNQSALDTELHQETLEKLLPICVSIGKDQKLVEKILAEWFTSGTLENISPKEIQTGRTPLNILCYNVQGWGPDALKLRYWAETNRLVPAEQYGFRPDCLLQTRVLSTYQQVKNNMTPNIPTLAVYVDYQKAYSQVWHKGLAVKLIIMSIPLGLLRLIILWLNDRRVHVIFGENKSKILKTRIGLPQGSSLSPYLFIVYHSDLVTCLSAFSSHIFADDLNVLISPPTCRGVKPMIKFLEEERTKICNKIAYCSKNGNNQLISQNS